MSCPKIRTEFLEGWGSQKSQGKERALRQGETARNGTQIDQGRHAWAEGERGFGCYRERESRKTDLRKENSILGTH